MKEIHSLSYPEYLKWQTFYSIEPFGFTNDEFRFSALMSQIHNQQAKKRSELKKVTHWMRDMIKGVFDELKKMKLRQFVEQPDLSTEEGRKIATDRAIEAFNVAFGGQLSNPRKKK